MARRAKGSLDSLLESWADWCVSGDVGLRSSKSMLAKMIDNHGLVNFSSGGCQAPVIDSIESRVEGVVMVMASNNQLMADVLRLEYDAGFAAVLRRRAIHNYDPETMGQFEKASALGISVRTYRRRLAEAREQVINQLSKIRKMNNEK